MQLRTKHEILLIDLLTVILVFAVLFSSGPLRVVLGLPFLLFFPGYVLLAALFPRTREMEIAERLALSFGMSIVVVPLMGLALNYTPWGITVQTTLFSVAAFILVLSGVAMWRRRGISEADRFMVNINLRLSGTVGDRALTIILAVAMLGALGTLGFAIAKPKVGEKFTEFYILGSSGKAADYPRELKLNETGTVIVGIINRQQAAMTYRVEVQIDGIKVNGLGPVVLENDGKWENTVSFTPYKTGVDQRVDFLLYGDGANQAAPMQSLHLWINVK